MVEMRANNNYWKNQWTTPRDEGKKQQWPRNGTKIRVFSTTTTTSLLMIDWCGPQLQRRLNFSCWFTFRQTLATILASLKCKVIQFQERKLEISTAAVFKVTEIAFSSSSLAAAEAGLKRLRLKSLKKVSLRFNFTFYCKMFEFFIKKLLWNL